MLVSYDINAQCYPVNIIVYVVYNQLSVYAKAGKLFATRAACTLPRDEMTHIYIRRMQKNQSMQIMKKRV
jgi:hypothetical protein